MDLKRLTKVTPGRKLSLLHTFLFMLTETTDYFLSYHSAMLRKL